ncbi:ABC transporter substrate-binding protein [Telmatospirillum sp. J64-1]|uniref:ABC transporter substrate-binding protein n=1 Tax=Telmatospirillum sp. J64-1 TaxID=2502183 RepID=UPI00115E8C81|nr:ABC transporter substrate-binding protein [Telmatospirillum sp. J64-1]
MNSDYKKFALSRRAFLGASAGVGTILLAGGLPIGLARAQTGSHLRFGLSSFPPNLNPFEYTGTASLTVKLLIYRGLLSYAADGSVRPELAESWRQVDPVTYEFVLRENARFHDGSVVQAEDVKFSYETIAAENSTAHLRKDFQIVESVDILDPRTVRVVLKQPSVTFPQVVASGYAMIVSRNSSAPGYVGAGPFTLGNIDRGSAIQLQAFSDYYKSDLPGVQSLRFIAMPDESLRIAALESGDVDVIEYVSTQQFERLRNDKGITLQSVNGPFMYLVFNTEQGPFTDPRLRRAVGYAIDRDAINKIGFSGVGEPMGGLPIPDGPAYDPSLGGERLGYDPARAQALLAEAGVSTLTIEFLSTAQYAQHNDTALVVQQNLAAVGIQCKMNLPDWASRVTQGNRGQYHLAVNGTAGAFNDPDAVSAYLEGGQPPSYTRPYGYNNDEINELLRKGREEMEPSERAKIYGRIEEIALQEMPFLPLLWRPQAYALRDSVKNFGPLPGFLVFQSGLRLEEASLV